MYFMNEIYFNIWDNFYNALLPVNMLEHVKIWRNVFECSLLMSLQHLIHEVNVPEVVAGAGLILDLEGGGNHVCHHVRPVVVLNRHDHLVNVKQRNVFVPEEYTR